jgi:hypothetical protein
MLQILLTGQLIEKPTYRVCVFIVHSSMIASVVVTIDKLIAGVMELMRIRDKA